MSFVMFYDERNRANLDKLADRTRLAAYKWYQYCIDNQINILIYETIRTKQKQAENVRKGVSKTMKSYHLVGQALDFVPVDLKGVPGWSINSYTRGKVLDAIKHAKKLGFTWGGDWDNDGDWRDETFLDSPHLQFNFTGYGKDTFGKIKDNGDDLTMSQYNDLLAKINKQDEKIAKLEKVTSLNETGRKEIQELLKKARKVGIIDAKFHTDAKIAQYDDAQLLSYQAAVINREFK